MADQEQWLIVKRDLYYRPDRCGYTGIRDHAGRYSQAEAEAEAQHEGITAVRLADAPEFSKGCYHDLALKHVLKQRDETRARLADAIDHINAIRRAFGAPGDWGYEQPTGKALYAAYRFANEMPERANG